MTNRAWPDAATYALMPASVRSGLNPIHAVDWIVQALEG